MPDPTPEKTPQNPEGGDAPSPALRAVDAQLARLSQQEAAEDQRGEEIMARADWLRHIALAEAKRLRRQRPNVTGTNLRALDGDYAQACSTRALCDQVLGAAPLLQTESFGKGHKPSRSASGRKAGRRQ